MPQRIEQLKNWLSSLPEIESYTFEPASGDASFRRYFRIETGDKSYIAMDAPPEKEDTKPFIRMAEALESIGLRVPHIFARNQAEGFLLLSDLGKTLYLDCLDETNVDRLYGDALGALVVIQACGPVEGLTDYDRTLLLQEMELFREWLLERHHGLSLTDDEQSMLDAVFDFLAGNALDQPQVCVHRDYHSRNLMVTGQSNPGIIDFQDAVVGPVTYDLVSLLRDCYIQWPKACIEAWVMGYYELAVQSGVLRSEHEDQFLRWFDLMGVQRHLKASGIFARLNIRDGKPGYLQDIPRTLNYILEVAPDYPELEGLEKLIHRIL
ncbi:MAG: aminoglycoside phosphotransferase [endosymbiont of Seepiophila jonesi]|uniref:Aminoglycoside phosphotransferase n=1 Tax=endosymbiont of Lamellibrachia luymesi TaxID=2200907 RepID=A0A370DVR7_9GAMM|nr:MAG: aminoglycoside phosphotransferase [endosymbiont of Lamellibrachia luymesi]RDH94593.1 MAG: aminoglycoside phosphotransferase [endosymbiont of Seepiophila jonesi]